MLVNSGSAHCGESDQFEGGGNTLTLRAPVALLPHRLRRLIILDARQDHSKILQSFCHPPTKDQSMEDRGRYESRENHARLRKRGLWIECSQIEPWEWLNSKSNSKAK